MFNGSEIKKKLDDYIAYENSPNFNFRVDSDYGTITPAGIQTKKVGDEFEIQVKISKDYRFNGFKSFDANQNKEIQGVVSFSEVNETINGNIITYTSIVKILKVYENLKIIADVNFIASVVSAFPADSLYGVNCDSIITINFNSEMNENDFKDFKNIRIYRTPADGSNSILDLTSTENFTSSFFESPVLSSDKKTVTIKPVGSNRILDDNGDTTCFINVVLSDSLKTASGDSISFSWKYLVNKAVEKENPVITEIKFGKSLNKNGEVTDLFSDISDFVNFSEEEIKLNHHSNKFYVYVKAYDASSGIKGITAKENLIRNKDGSDINEDFASKKNLYGEFVHQKENGQFTGYAEAVFEYDIASTKEGVVKISFNAMDYAGNFSLDSKILNIVFDNTINICPLNIFNRNPKQTEYLDVSMFTKDNINKTVRTVYWNREPEVFYKGVSDYYSYEVKWGTDKDNLEFSTKDISIIEDGEFCTAEVNVPDASKDTYVYIYATDAAGNIADDYWIIPRNAKFCAIQESSYGSTFIPSAYDVLDEEFDGFDYIFYRIDESGNCEVKNYGRDDKVTVKGMEHYFTHSPYGHTFYNIDDIPKKIYIQTVYYRKSHDEEFQSKLYGKEESLSWYGENGINEFNYTDFGFSNAEGYGTEAGFLLGSKDEYDFEYLKYEKVFFSPIEKVFILGNEFTAPQLNPVNEHTDLKPGAVNSRKCTVTLSFANEAELDPDADYYFLWETSGSYDNYETEKTFVIPSGQAEITVVPYACKNEKVVKGEEISFSTKGPECDTVPPVYETGYYGTYLCSPIYYGRYNYLYVYGFNDENGLKSSDNYAEKTTVDYWFVDLENYWNVLETEDFSGYAKNTLDFSIYSSTGKPYSSNTSFIDNFYSGLPTIGNLKIVFRAEDRNGNYYLGSPGNSGIYYTSCEIEPIIQLSETGEPGKLKLTSLQIPRISIGDWYTNNYAGVMNTKVYMWNEGKAKFEEVPYNTITTAAKRNLWYYHQLNWADKYLYYTDDEFIKIETRQAPWTSDTNKVNWDGYYSSIYLSVPYYYYTGDRTSNLKELRVDDKNGYATIYADNAYIYEVAYSQYDHKDSKTDWGIASYKIDEAQEKTSKTFKIDPTNIIPEGWYYVVMAHFADGSTFMSDVYKK